MGGYVIHGSTEIHRRYMQPVCARSRRRCHCGCNRRATHIGVCNGVAMTQGCELYVRRWVRDGTKARYPGAQVMSPSHWRTLEPGMLMLAHFCAQKTDGE